MRRLIGLLIVALLAHSATGRPDEVASVATDLATDECDSLTSTEINSFANLDRSDCVGWPKWYVQAESLLLWRDNNARYEQISLLPDRQTATLPQLDGGVGPQITIGLQTSQYSGWEGKYFSVFNMNGMSYGRAQSPQGGLSTPFVLDPYAGFTDFGDLVAATSYRIDYRTELHSAEVNHVHTWNQFSALAGFRFLRLNENFEESLINDNDEPDARNNRNTENNLYGGQLGARWRNSYQWLALDVTGKAGVFGNDAQQRQSLQIISGEAEHRPATSYDSNVAFVGDINFSVTARLHPMWSARLGYNLIWIDSVALAPDQTSAFQAVSIPQPGDSPQNSTHQNSEVAASGSVFLHGVNVGLEGRW